MTRVLFVESNPTVLEAIHRAVRPLGGPLQLEFCEDADEAIHFLLAEPFDVVVSDLQMPGMDGAELLSRVRELSPGSVRIVLCEQADEARVLRAVTAAHQYLAKPFSAVQLREAITCACCLAERINSEEVRKLVTRINALPSLPDIYIRLVALMRDDDASIQDVAELIAEDVGMTAKVLQLVNSPFFGLATHVSDAHHAAALLGMKMLRPLVLTASIFRQFEVSNVPLRVLNSILEHGMAVGGVARQIAEAAGLSRDSVDNAFLAGMLHDTGQLVMLDHFGANYGDLLRQTRLQPDALPAKEIGRFGATHAAVGGYLFGLWGLPNEIVQVVAFHHDPSSDHRRDFNPLTAVHLADALCYEAELTDTDCEQAGLSGSEVPPAVAHHGRRNQRLPADHRPLTAACLRRAQRVEVGEGVLVANPSPLTPPLEARTCSGSTPPAAPRGTSAGRVSQTSRRPTSHR